MNTWFVYAVPLGAAFIGLVACVSAVRDSRAFDREFGAQPNCTPGAALSAKAALKSVIGD